MSLHHIVSAQDIAGVLLDGALKKINHMVGFAASVGFPQSADQRRIALLFYGPVSRRTYDSFEMAIQDLGWLRAGGANAESFSGMVKGESLEHAVKFYGRHCHAIVMRHEDPKAQARAAAYARVPILSAGGSAHGEHPTQALGDYALLRSILHNLKDAEIAFVGNLRDSSSVHSLCHWVGKDLPKKVYLVEPQGCELQGEYRAKIPTAESLPSVRDIPLTTRVIYLVQSPNAKEPANYRIDAKALKRFEGVHVLHPLPEGPELPKSVQADLRVKVQEQLSYAHFARMACLELLAGEK